MFRSGRIGPIVVSQERSDPGVGLRVGLQGSPGDAIDLAIGNPVVRERLALIFEIPKTDFLCGVKQRVPARGFGVVQRERPTRPVDEIREIPHALLGRRQGQKIGASDSLPRTLVRQSEKRLATTVIQFGHQQRPADGEAKLVAPKNVAVSATLDDFVWDGVQDIVAEVLEDAAVPRTGATRNGTR